MAITSPETDSVWRLEDLPSPRGLPLVGNFHQLLNFEELHRRIESWEAELGQTFAFRMFSKLVLVTSDPKLADIVLHERPEAFRRLSTIETVTEELGLNGLFSVEGAAWFRQRNLILQALGPNQLPEFFPTLRTITGRLRSRWERVAKSGGVTDVVEDLTRYTVDVTSSLSFGQDVNTLEHEEDAVQRHLGVIFPKLTSRIFSPVPYWQYVKLPSDRKLERSLGEIRAHIQNIIDRAHVDLKAQSGVPRNLLQSMLSAAAEPNSGITDRDVYANVLTLLLAGEDTTAHALAWTLYFLSQRPDLQALLRDEAREALGEAAIAPDYETTAKLTLFDGVAFEAMRFKPVTPLLGLETNRDFVLDGIVLPAGTQVFLCARPAMMDDRYFTNAQAFEPGRWSRRAEGASRQAFTQFGGGPRVCPGRSLAIREIRMVLSMLSRNFSIEFAGDPSEVREIFSFTMKPSSVPLRLRMLN